MVESYLASIQQLGAVGIWIALTASCAPAGTARCARTSRRPAGGRRWPAIQAVARQDVHRERAAAVDVLHRSFRNGKKGGRREVRGSPIEDVKRSYEGKPNARLNVATVDKVFGEQVSTAWDYAVGFFGECAREMAGVSPDRVQLASYCMQNQLMAEVAFQYKVSGKPKEQAYAHFVQFKSSTPKSIVDLVYASTKERAAVRMEVWNTCMADLSGG